MYCSQYIRKIAIIKVVISVTIDDEIITIEDLTDEQKILVTDRIAKLLNEK